jgi:hypothetical protein
MVSQRQAALSIDRYAGVAISLARRAPVIANALN